MSEVQKRAETCREDRQAAAADAQGLPRHHGQDQRQQRGGQPQEVLLAAGGHREGKICNIVNGLS